jgi:acetyl esterase/lipase
MLAAAAIPVAALPGLWRIAPGYGALVTMLALAQLGTAIMMPLRPQVRVTRYAAAGSTGLFLLFWALDRLARVLPGPDPWQPTDTVLGSTDQVFAVLQLLALLFATWQIWRPHTRRRPLAGTASGITMALVVVVSSAGVAAAGNAFLPWRHDTVEYCRPAGIPLPMDIYRPSEPEHRPAPVAVYIHGGGFLLGNRAPGGLGALLANSDGALFTPLRQRLNDLGYLVASIDYRLAPAAPWPAPVTDAACAIRFLKANAAALRVDPHRIAAWGSSAGGTIVSLLGVAGGRFDTGQYLDRSSSVNAVVDMFGAADLTGFANAGGFSRTTLRLSLGDDPTLLRTASPATYLRPGAAPFLILHGTEDPLFAQSLGFANQLRAAGDAATFLPVHGTGHQLDTPGQQPTVGQLVAAIAGFLNHALAWTPVG